MWIMANIVLNNKIETRLNTNGNMQKIVSYLSRFLWDNKTLSANEMNDNNLMFILFISRHVQCYFGG